MRTDYITQIEGGQRRAFAASPEVRAKADQEGVKRIEGYAALYNVETDLGWFIERIAPGAFDEVVQDDVRALFNHDPNYVLARSVNGQGTLRLKLDESGLMYEFDVDQEFSNHVNLAKSIERGDVTQSSFAFTILKDEWTYNREQDKDVRTILKVKRLYDVSPVTYPAYESTTVSARDIASAQERIARWKMSASARQRQLDLALIGKFNTPK